jgi:peptidoglycan/LPS O-acetylase OafA/YrhL
MLTRLFQRKTQSTSFIPEIDGLRFFAIITVIIYHFNTAYSRALGIDDLAMEALGGQSTFLSPAWWIIRLDLGVKVFFSISGMVLAIPFIKSIVSGERSVGLKDYYSRRLTRLEPPFIISLLIFFIVHNIVLETKASDLWPNLMAGLFYLHQIIYGTANPINPVTWSLETEAQFYLIVPLFFGFFSRSNKLWIRILFILVLVIFSVWFKLYSYKNEIVELQASILYYLTNFMTGVVFAWIYIRYREWFSRKSLMGDILGLICTFLLFYYYKPQYKPINNILFSLSSFGLMYGVFKGTALNWLFTRPFIYIIGGMCYSIYLLHYAMLHLFTKFTTSISIHQGYLTDLLLQLIILLPLILFISSIFYLFIEKPCMDKNWPKKLIAWFKTRIQKSGI